MASTSVSSTSKCCLFCTSTNPQKLTNSNSSGTDDDVVGDTGEELSIKKEDISAAFDWTTLVSSSTSATTTNLLQDQLKIVFILRKLLNLPEEKLSEYLQLNDGGDNLIAWFSVCTSCIKIVEEGYKVYCKLAQLKRALAEITNNLKGLILTEQTSKNNRRRSKSRNSSEEAKMGLVCLKIREYIISENKPVDTGAVPKDKFQGTGSCSKRKATPESLPCSFAPTTSHSPINPIDTTTDHQEMRAPDTNVDNEEEEEEEEMEDNFYVDDKDDQDWQPGFDDDEEMEEKEKVPFLTRVKSDKRTKKSRESGKTDKEELKSTAAESLTTEHSKTQEGVEEENKIQRVTYMLKCNMCAATYRDKKSYRKHQRLHSSNTTETKACSHCGWLCDKNKLIFHVRKHHCIKRKCRRTTLLKKGMLRKYEYKTVVKTKVNLPYYCDHCPMIFINKIPLLSHISLHHPKVSLVSCTFCNCSGFETKQLLELHCREEHPTEVIEMTVQDSGTQDEGEICPHCSESFLSKMDRDYHIAKLHRRKLLICKVCGHESKKCCDYMAHMKTKHENEKFLCEHCPKSFNSLRYLQCHMRVAHGIKFDTYNDIYCPECKVACHSKAGLRSHIEHVHKKVKQLFCEHCGKAFSRNGDLKKHILLHTAPREMQYKQGPFFCEFCQAKFNVRQGLYYHLKKVHSDRYSFKCEHCGTGYVTQNTLTQHQRKCKAVHVAPAAPASSLVKPEVTSDT